MGYWVTQPVAAQVEPPAGAPGAPGVGGAGSPEAATPIPAAPSAPEPAQRSLLTAIEVQPGATCLAADKLVRRVERWLDQTKVDARIRVHVRGDDAEPNEVEFSIDRGDGLRPAVRRIENAPLDCEQLHSALALSIALAIDASILGGAAEGLELPDDEALTEEPEDEGRAGPSYLRVAAAVLGEVSTGLITSDIALGAGARLELGFTPWLELRAGALFTGIGGQRVQSVPGTFSASIVAGRADACGVLQPAEALRLLACGAFVLGELRTTGHDFMETSSEGSLWSAAGGGIEVQAAAADPLAFVLGVDVLIPFARKSVLVLDPMGRAVASRDLTSVGVVIGVGVVFRVF